MSKLRRRAVLAAMASGLAGGTFLTTTGSPAPRPRGGRAVPGDVPVPAPAPEPAPAPTPAVTEAKRRGLPGHGWKLTDPGIRASSDKRLDITGYASSTSVNLGERLEFHVSMAARGRYQIDIFRMGHYGAEEAGWLGASPVLDGVRQTVPSPRAGSGSITCEWPSVWALTVPRDWMSGNYLGVLTTEDGWRSYVPFVVRDDERRAELCVVAPTTTYQAYNLWPKDMRKGKSLYYGYALKATTEGATPTRQLDYTVRAVEVSFDRPYANAGRPSNIDLDWTFGAWAEESGYDVVYATSQDLHEGRIDPSRYAALVFAGHDEYWSREMRQRATDAVAAGTSLVFLSANNVYWHVRLPEVGDGRTGRLLTCYKGRSDEGGELGERTGLWRSAPGPEDPEQRLLGVQFNGILARPVPLVVQGADHWFWAGTEVQEGDRIEGVVGAEADGVSPDVAHSHGTQTLLAASPYTTTSGVERTQHTSLIEAPSGAIIFAAGSLIWSRFLGAEGDDRIRRATGNLLDRVLARRRAPLT
ncbi:hypothetical protein Cme02nite_68960 [Catellatospora methionotrophica]|uniref:N,N-dimethylformamidase beta subunit-like C-terminal domain-containing protein n=1 Tax=Catellatospora methionotrophica TaxID=121620 RepID=A0A8J3LN19_9ACTN|nr:N,N-dimethylformamidase beta subunit family domain-containing protein [Catellatospora methionotrophica]GIG18564.1 hypothetical protein Cme02nite_68960 [Catellatospora methionotrophica]